MLTILLKLSFLCAVAAEDTRPRYLRTYRNPLMADSLSRRLRLWEALRATSAASTFFDLFCFEATGQRFHDGGIRCNNPVELVYQEAAELWPGREAILLSIGTGNKPGESIIGNIDTVALRMAEIATETEDTADRFNRNHTGLVDRDLYFRFNVPGLSRIELGDYKQNATMITHTETYLMDADTGRKLRRCCAKLEDSIGN